MKNDCVEISIQKGFTPGMSGTFEHAAHLAHLIHQEKRNQRSLVVTLLDLRNAFGEVHHNLIPVVLAHHHIPNNIIKGIMSIYDDFASPIATDSFATLFFHIKKGVLQGDCLSPLVFNLIINTIVQFVPQQQFSQLGYSLTNLLRPTYWFQFADDAAVATGQEYETQIPLNVFSTWCTWSKMIIRVDKCHTFGIMKKNTTSTQTKVVCQQRNNTILTRQ